MQVYGESLSLRAAHQARQAEAAGYDGIVAVDHFFSARAAAAPRWRIEPFVALGVAAASTTRIQLAAMVVNSNFHHPSVIAHAMASLDQLSGGRAELGLGGGWYAAEHRAFGLPWGAAAERQARLLEAARICRTMLENRGVVSHHGEHFQLENSMAWDWAGARRVPVVIGGSRRALLCAAAEIANRVDLLHASVHGNPVVDEKLARPPEAVENLIREIHDHASASGNAVKVSATITASIAMGPAEAVSLRAELAPMLHSTKALLDRDLLYVAGTQRELLDKIGLLAGLGVDRVHVIPGPIEPARTAAAVGEMLRDIQRLPAAPAPV